MRSEVLGDNYISMRCKDRLDVGHGGMGETGDGFAGEVGEGFELDEVGVEALEGVAGLKLSR